MRFLLLISFLLVSCAGSLLYVFDESGRSVGSVSMVDAESATIYDQSGEVLGVVKGNLIYNKVGNITGTVTPDDRILDSTGRRIGRLSGEDCLNRAGVTVGMVGDVQSDEVAGGACMLLLL